MPRSKKQQPQVSTSKDRRAKRRLAYNADLMTDITPITPNQEKIFKAWEEGKHLFIYGCAGTGKTFCALYNALQSVLKDNADYDSVYLVRSLVATREVGFLPGDLEDKTTMWQVPYREMVKYMFELSSDEEFDMLYGNLRSQGSIQFQSTSFLRGVTLDNSVIIIDEMQNLNFHELDSIITRVGEGSRIIFCGDAYQSDLVRDKEKNGIHDFMRILEAMPDDFALVEMGVDDIVRSGLVRNYLVTKHACGFWRLPFATTTKTLKVLNSKGFRSKVSATTERREALLLTLPLLRFSRLSTDPSLQTGVVA